MNLVLRQRAVDRFKTDEMLRKFRFSAARNQAEFYKITHGRSPKVTKASIEEEAQRLFENWRSRQRLALPQGNTPDDILNVKFSESPKNARGRFECPRCYRIFRVQEKYAKHAVSHYTGIGTSDNAVRMAEVEAGRGLERTSRRLSETEKEDIMYFLNDNY